YDWQACRSGVSFGGTSPGAGQKSPRPHGMGERVRVRGKNIENFQRLNTLLIWIIPQYWLTPHPSPLPTSWGEGTPVLDHKLLPCRCVLYETVSTPILSFAAITSAISIGSAPDMPSSVAVANLTASISS